MMKNSSFKDNIFQYQSTFFYIYHFKSTYLFQSSQYWTVETDFASDEGKTIYKHIR